MTTSSLIVFVCILFVSSSFAATIICEDPDCGRNVTELIKSKGYPVEEHTVQTPDGYLLGVQRIPYGRSGNNGKRKPVVLLQHGLLDASHTWVINFPHQSLGFILADMGYDVWLGNNRGNVYSKNHVTLSPHSREFWEFSFDEMGKYDLPAMIDYILEATNETQLVQVGHSEGTMQAFIAYQNQSIADKVKLFVALAPVAYIANMKSEPLKLLAKFDGATLLKDLGFKQFLPSSKDLHDLLETSCDISDKLCNDAMCTIMGCDPKNWNASRWDVYSSLDPAGTSMQNMVHFQQLYKKKNWCMQDFGYFGNKKHYGHHHYPCYDLNEVKAKVGLFSGGKDDLADPDDVEKIRQQLNPSVLVDDFTISYYSHLDFVWGLDAHTALYPNVTALIQKYSPLPTN